MKKTFKLEHPKIKVPRLVDSIKSDIRKYLKRERRKTLPADATFWDFDCKIGETEDSAVDVHLSALIKNVDKLVAKNTTTIYVQILAKPVTASPSDTM